MALSGKSLNAATSAGPGVAIVPDTPKQTATMTITTTGSPTFSIALQGSVDGENWFDLNTTNAATTISTQHNTEAGPSTPALDDQRVCIAFRANLTSISDSSVSASIAIKE